MVVVSEPVKQLPGGGNAKYIKECTELYLGRKGIEKIRGFEQFVNLATLWLDHNKLEKINNLDNNFKIKVLCAQDNQICTLKGSLEYFKFLEHLDLSDNQLGDLEKILTYLKRFQFLTHLNLKGNPCCEEPDYRMLTIHALPSVRVLDMHVVTDAERQKVKAVIGQDVAALTVAFGKRVPASAIDPAVWERVPEVSYFERETVKEASDIRNTIREQQHDEYQKLFSHNPNPEIQKGATLPPNAGTVRARQLWETQQREHMSRGSSPSSTSRKNSGSPYRPKDVLTLYSTQCNAVAEGQMQTAGTNSSSPSKPQLVAKRVVL